MAGLHPRLQGRCPLHALRGRPPAPRPAARGRRGSEHSALMLAATTAASCPEFEGEGGHSAFSSDVQSCVAWFCNVDMVGNPYFGSMMEESASDSDAAKASPIHHVTGSRGTASALDPTSRRPACCAARRTSRSSRRTPSACTQRCRGRASSRSSTFLRKQRTAMVSFVCVLKKSAKLGCHCWLLSGLPL